MERTKRAVKHKQTTSTTTPESSENPAEREETVTITLPLAEYEELLRIIAEFRRLRQI